MEPVRLWKHHYFWPNIRKSCRKCGRGEESYKAIQFISNQYNPRHPLHYHSCKLRTAQTTSSQRLLQKELNNIIMQHHGQRILLRSGHDGRFWRIAYLAK